MTTKKEDGAVLPPVSVLLSTRNAAKFVGIGLYTFMYMRDNAKGFPKYITLTKANNPVHYYKAAELKKYFEALK